jgi:multidrug efflux pump subunit AcrA (membrane-fusion protein)
MNLNNVRPLAVAASVTLFFVADGALAQTVDPVLERALVKFKEDKELPARETGVLAKLTVKQGEKVEAGQEIGLIDDSEPQLQKKVADYARVGAYKRWKDDVELRYAAKQAAVAEKDYEMLVETNRQATKAVPEVEIRRAKLDWERADLAIEKAGHDQELAKYEYYTKTAEVEAANLAIKRRTIVAPFAGEVVELDRKQDEWVNPGDRILRLAQLDTMIVEGAIKQSDYDPSRDGTLDEPLSEAEGASQQNEYDPQELDGCAVTVEVQLARGRIEKFSGHIVYASPVLFANGDFLVRAEVPNREQNGNWMLLDGQKARMTIHLNTAGGAAPEISRRP